MRPELSIVMPGIRPNLWEGVFNSILESTKRAFELIIVSPFPLPPALTAEHRVKYIRDFGSPVRASQIGITLCEGSYVSPNMCDDGLFFKNALDNNLDLLLAQGTDIKNVITCRYSESIGYSRREDYQADSVYNLVNSYPANPAFVPADWYIFNSTVMHTQYLLDLGGFDCFYGATPVGHADLAIRAQKDGARVTLSPYPLAMADHGHTDHFAVAQCQVQVDLPAFSNKYNRPIDDLVIRIPLDNWKQSDRIWKFRFVEK